MQRLTGREERGRQIVEKGTEIERLDDKTYRVASQSGNGFYQVLFSSPKGWTCSCPDCVNRSVKCKHVWAVEFSANLRKEVQAKTEIVKIEQIDISECRFCASKNIVRDGVRHNKAGSIQIWSCRDCKRYFSYNLDRKSVV